MRPHRFDARIPALRAQHPRQPGALASFRRGLRTIAALLIPTILLTAFIADTASAAFTASDIAVIVNDRDPLSVATAKYFVRRRAIPAENVIHVAFDYEKPVMASRVFADIHAQTLAATPPGVQAYALTWASPVRVNCMSITSAFAFGYAQRHCAKACRAIAPNPWFDSTSTRPYDDFGMRPTMTIAARGIENAKFLIDRGALADYTRPAAARAYLVITPDKSRNARTASFQRARRDLASHLPISIVRSRGISETYDIMFYFTGIRHVPHLDTVGFLPGAMADHLTSAGGRLLDSKQMSALAWLEAGATGSYGTVVEPCNFPQKFPDPAVAMKHYLAGDTLIEAYWKSVVWAGQGIFIGEPLARPYAARPATEAGADG